MKDQSNVSIVSRKLNTTTRNQPSDWLAQTLTKVSKQPFKCRIISFLLFFTIYPVEWNKIWLKKHFVRRWKVKLIFHDHPFNCHLSFHNKQSYWSREIKSFFLTSRITNPNACMINHFSVIYLFFDKYLANIFYVTLNSYY